jgi:hypothetical protein
MKSHRNSAAFLILVMFVTAMSALRASGQIQVTSASPTAAPQGTTSLNVTISGSGFKSGAVAKWYVTGTTNPGGVTVNSISGVRSNTLTANITIAAGAVISGFDIVVTNTDGRTGKGTDKFAVTAKGTPIGCYSTGTPSGFSLVTQLNPVQSNGAALITTGAIGNAIRVRPLDLNGDGTVDTLAAFVTSGAISGGAPGTYVFLLDPTTGLPQTVNPITSVAWQNPILLLSGVRAVIAAAGDVNGDHIPDFLMGGADNNAYLFVGSVAPSTFNLSYTAYHIQPTSDAPANWAIALAMGDLDGDGKDEIAIGATPGKKGPTFGGAFIFKYASGSLTYTQKIQDPSGTASAFGSALAIGNIDGTPGNDLAVGGSTLVYVFHSPVQQSSYFSLSGPGPAFGRGLGIADVDLDGQPDLVIITGDQFNGSDTTAMTLIFSGPVSSSSGYTNQLLPASGLAYSWASPNFDLGDMMLAGGAILIGTPNANNPQIGSACNGYVGAAQLFTSPFSSTESPSFVFEPPAITANGMDYGYGVAVVPAYPFIVVGAKLADVGTSTQAGQVYVYKVN